MHECFCAQCLQRTPTVCITQSQHPCTPKHQSRTFPQIPCTARTHSWTKTYTSWQKFTIWCMSMFAKPPRSQSGTHELIRMHMFSLFKNFKSGEPSQSTTLLFHLLHYGFKTRQKASLKKQTDTRSIRNLVLIFKLQTRLFSSHLGDWNTLGICENECRKQKNSTFPIFLSSSHRSKMGNPNVLPTNHQRGHELLVCDLLGLLFILLINCLNSGQICSAKFFLIQSINEVGSFQLNASLLRKEKRCW